MFRTFARIFLPNPFDWMLKRMARRGGKRVLLAWNRGLGDIALGLYAMAERIRDLVPNAEITFLIRENLKEGFSMFEGVKTLIAPDWKRGQRVFVKETLHQLGIDPKEFDLIVEKPSPTDWVRWQLGKVVPRLKWEKKNDALYEKFQLSKDVLYVGVQVVAETNYGLWRNWPKERWEELFNRLGNVKFLLFGFGDEPKFSAPNIVDLRGKTTLFELLSIIKNRCRAVILPDSGILSMTYYLDESFPIRVLSLWADPNHGILKQAAGSPNPQLTHCPLIGRLRNLSTVTVDDVIKQLFPLKPLEHCISVNEIEKKPIENVGCIVLAGGQGSRLNQMGPKGLFPIAGKTLFQWICEKVARKDLPLAIMTSPLNHNETVAYFKKNDFFGLKIHFFQQEMHPFLDENKQPMKVEGPKGNGSVFSSFVKANLADLFARRGIDLLTVIHVENPLADPFDPALISYARSEKADVVCKCIRREENNQSMGVLVEREKRIEIIEYTELDPTLSYPFSYCGQLAFNLSFFKKMAEIDLPLHWVRKKNPLGLDAWKGEQFIFDALPYASSVRAIQAPRESCYAPIKNLENVESVENMLRKKL